jgi:hypothetical protein
MSRAMLFSLPAFAASVIAAGAETLMRSLS